MHAEREASEQVFRMSLEGTEVAVKLIGKGAKELAIILYTMLTQQTKSRGAVRLATMLKQNPNAVIYSINKDNMKEFAQAAKQYGILYCATQRPSQAKDGMIDIVVRAEDAARVNRIAERFGFNVVKSDMSIKTEKTDKVKPKREQTASKEAEHETAEDTQPPEQQEEKRQQAENLIDDLLGKPAPKEKGITEVLQDVADEKGEAASNPISARAGKSPLSAPNSKKAMSSKTGTVGKKTSVKQALDTISKAEAGSSSGKAKAIPDKTFSPPTMKGR